MKNRREWAMNATASDFEKEAQKAANATWFWLIATGILVYFFGWWWLLLGLVCLYTAFESFMDTRAAMRLERGVYEIPNRNNGAPKGDATGMTDEELEAYKRKTDLARLKKSAEEGKLFR